jgi:hypothetical protein
MKKIKLIISLMVLAGFAAVCAGQDKSIYEQQGFTKIFNGKDLTGWVAPVGDNGHWSVIDGVIDYDARSEASGDKNLWTEKEYKDFCLHIEWRFKGYGDHLFPLPTILPNGDYLRDANGKIIEPLGPNSDSGILLKASGQVNLWCWSVGSGELWSVRTNEAMPPEARAAAVPKENADQPVGQWNAFDITLKGDRITVINNGITVIENALYPGMAERGRLGLQHHGGINPATGKLQGASSLVQFRNIWIKEL